MSFWYHGSKSPITRFRDDKIEGIHFGSLSQARMRNPAYIHEVSIAGCPEGRTRDRQSWTDVVRRAERKGVGLLRYLNRFEGIPSERIEQLIVKGDIDRLDKVSDAAFRKLVPEAEMSIVVTDPYLITLHRVYDRTGEIVWQREPRPEEARDSLAPMPGA